MGPDLKSHAYFLPYATDYDDLTSQQVRMIQSGYEYRLSQKIEQVDEDGIKYDLAERLRVQIGFYPFTGKKDLIDAASRIYDLDPRAPAWVDDGPIEPEEV